MKYSTSANIINIGFILAFFFVPIAVAVMCSSISVELGEKLVALSFVLVVLALLDWYHSYFSNTLSCIIFWFTAGLLIALFSVGFVMTISNHSFMDLMLIEDIQQWKGYRILFKLYVIGVGISAITTLSLPRLLLMKLLVSSPLPVHK